MILPDRRRRAVPGTVAGLMLLGALGCSRGTLRPPDGSAQAELRSALATATEDVPHAPDRPPMRATSGSEITENLLRGHREAEAGRLDQAARFYQRVLREEPGHPTAHHRLAVIADQNRDFTTAERHYASALEARPNDPDVLNDLGYCYFLQGRYPDSERLLREAIDIAPGHKRALTNLGSLYAEIGDSDRALAVLRLTGTEEEAKARLTLLAPRAGGSATERDALAPPLASASERRVVPAGATAVADEAQPGSPSAAMRDLMDQLTRARQEAAAQRTQRVAAAVLPGLIDPAGRALGGSSIEDGENEARPYTRGARDPHVAARMSIEADGPPSYGGRVDAPYGPTPSRSVTANSQAASPRSDADLPLWSPQGGVEPHASSAFAPRVPTYDEVPASAGLGTNTAAPRLPPPAYSVPERYSEPRDDSRSEGGGYSTSSVDRFGPGNETVADESIAFPMRSPLRPYDGHAAAPGKRPAGTESTW